MAKANKTRRRKPVTNEAHSRQVERHLAKSGDQVGRVALAIYAHMHEGFKPLTKHKPEGVPTLLRLAEHKRFRERELKAWSNYITDFEHAAGKSGNITMSWTEKIDGGSGLREPVSVYANAPLQRLERLYGEGIWQGRAFLHLHEQAILKDLTMEWLEVQKHRRRDGIGAEHFGETLGGYHQKDQSRANGAGWIRAVLKSLAQFYEIA